LLAPGGSVSSAQSVARRVRRGRLPPMGKRRNKGTGKKSSPKVKPVTVKPVVVSKASPQGTVVVAAWSLSDIRAKLKRLFGRVPLAYKVIAWLVSAVGLGFTVLSGIALLTPLVSITPTEVVNNAPFNSPFTVTNSSQFGLERITITCAIAQSETSKDFYVSGFDMTDRARDIPELDFGESTSINCPAPGTFQNDRYHMADVVVTANFRPMWAPWLTRTKSARFRTRLDDGGKMSWGPEAIHNP
jgi:hypothetical protein